MAEIESPLAGYLNDIATYNQAFKSWEGRASKIITRYRDEKRNQGNDGAKFNILWSNVQTLIPATYAKLPQASVSRRFSDNDPVGRVASLLVERALDYEIEHYPDFRATMNAGVADRFLGGRGTAWVRFEPHIKEQAPAEEAEQPEQMLPGMVPEDGYQITEDVEEEPLEEIEYECAPTDYVHWKDFGHSVARTWEEVTKVWRWVYMTKEAAEERFGEDVCKNLPFNTSPEGLNKQGMSGRVNDRARICELWDKERGKAVWFCEDVKELLDEVEDPLQLEGFFPCPRPLYATITSDSLVPVPDFALYQDQANTLDTLTDRITGLIQALRVRGVYDSSQPTLQRLLTEGDNNTLIPADKWAALQEKGGLKGVVDLLPIDMIAAALMEAYKAHDQVKQQIYEITGISDIVRGQGAASETATAQRIKGQYAGLRLKSMQESVALWATGLLRLKAQIICTKFQDQTILGYAAAAQMSAEDQQLISQAMQLLRQNPLRTFRIDVAADSLVMLDEQADKEDRTQFMTAFAGFLQQAVPAGQQMPELAPMLMEIMKFGVAGFKQARQIEGTIDAALQQLTMKAAASQGQPKPDPEAMKAQAMQASESARMQLEQAKLQATQALEGAKMQSEAAKIQAEREADQQKWAAEQTVEKHKLDLEYEYKQREADQRDELERFKAELAAQTAITVAHIRAAPRDSEAEVAA